MCTYVLTRNNHINTHIHVYTYTHTPSHVQIYIYRHTNKIDHPHIANLPILHVCLDTNKKEINENGSPRPSIIISVNSTRRLLVQSDTVGHEGSRARNIAEEIWGRYHGGRRPSSDDSLHSPTVIPPSALDKPSIMKRYHRRRTTR